MERNEEGEERNDRGDTMMPRAVKPVAEPGQHHLPPSPWSKDLVLLSV
jgi:hypothetical protein